MKSKRHLSRAAHAIGVCLLAAGSFSSAQAEETVTFDIPAQSLSKALVEFSKQSNTDVIASSELLNNRQAPAINGTMQPLDALQKMLRGTGLEFAEENGEITIVAADKQGQSNAKNKSLKRERSREVVIEDIIVTAQKREQKLSDVPMSISALSQREMDRAGIDNLLDLGAAVPSLTVIESGPGQNRIFMRGAANGNNITSLVGVYVDEMPVATASLAQLDLRMVDLERVEVLRGPQGTLYGQGSAGGTIRFITRDPVLDEFSANGSLSAYSTKGGGFSQEVVGVFNVPVVENVFGLRISGTYGNIDGWIDQPAANRENINNQDLTNLRIKALWRPLETMDVSATYVVHRNDGDGITAGADENYDIAFGFTPLAMESFADEYDLYNLTVTYDFGAMSLMSASSYMNVEKKTEGISLKFLNIETFNHDTIGVDVFTQEVRLSSSNAEKVNWVVGGFYRDESLDRLLMNDVAIDNAYLFTLIAPTDDQSKSWAIFGDASYSLTDRFEVGAGIRYFKDDRSGLVGADTFTSVDPRIYLSYKITDEVNLYFNAAEGFRSGGFGGGIGADVSFGPETVRSYEVGVKGDWWDGRLNADIALFFSEYKDIQTFRLISASVGGILTNAGDAEMKGIDIALDLEITEGLRLMANGNITDAKIVKVAPGAITQFVGDPVDFVNDYTVSLSGIYEFDWSDTTPGFLRLDYNRIGPAPVTDRSSGPVFFESDTIGLLNARVGLTINGWAFQLYGQNLLDDNDRQDPLAAFGFGSRPRPRTVGIKVGTDF